jgi:3-hydroxyacyl-CoA dehydrogenase
MPGFIANRILMPMINEAVFTLMEGTGNVEDIDMTMKARVTPRGAAGGSRARAAGH